MKHNKKKFALTGFLLIMVIICGMLSGCSATPKNTQETPQDLETEIKTEFLKAFVTPEQPKLDSIAILHYYGTFNGYAAALIDNGLPRWGVVIIYDYTVGDITLHHGYCDMIYAYKDQQIYEIREAYEQGFLTIDDVAVIADIQDGSAEAPTIGQELAQEIKIEYKNKFYPEPTVDDVTIEKFYGTFNGCTVVLIHYGILYMDVVDYNEIGGIKITYQMGNRLLAYKDKKLYWAREAYEQGFLTLDDIAVIAEIQNGK
jgi:hypothetical protein